METMTGLDAKFLYSETPTAHMHTVKVAVSNVSVIDGGFSYDTLLAVLGQQLGRLPPFRRRVVPVPWGLDHPVWVEDPEFDLKRHASRRSTSRGAIASSPLWWPTSQAPHWSATGPCGSCWSSRG
jgi:diacylglycerol O-acyltransferase